MLLALLEYPDNRLNMATEPVEEINDDILKKIHSMFDVMYDHSGIGLAANQVGLSESIIVFDCSEDHEVPVCLINPKIVAKRGAVVRTEGCLSFPGINLVISRAKEVDVNYMNINGKQETSTFNDLESVCVQHEIDHLNGETFLKRVNRNIRRSTLKLLGKRK